MIKATALLLSLALTLVGSPALAEEGYAPVRDRRYEIDVRLEALELERSRISTIGPQTATIVGIIAVAVGAVALGAGIKREDDCGNECNDGFGAMMAGTALMGIGGITAITAGAIWGHRVRHRNEIDAERESLMEERRGLGEVLSRLEVGSEWRNRTHLVKVGFRF